MTAITAHDIKYTLIVRIATAPEDHDDLVEHLKDTTNDHRWRPGFVSCAVHSTADRTSIAEYIQWSDRDAHQAMADSQDGREHIEPLLARSDLGVYDVYAVYAPTSEARPSSADSPTVCIPQEFITPTITMDFQGVAVLDIVHCHQEDQRALLELAHRLTASDLASRPGFVSASLHRSIDGGKIASYSQWNSEDDWHAARTDPTMRQSDLEAQQLGVRAHRNVYRADFVVDAPRSQ